MWWFRAIVLLLVGALASGCGFRPLYATAGAESRSEVVEAFAATAVLPIADRSGQLLRIELEEQLAPRGAPAAPRYVLQVVLREALNEVAVQRTGLATRANLRLVATYTLRDPTSGATIFEDTTASVSSYDLLENKFATLIALKDARSRAVSRIADNIRTRLGVFYRAAASAEPSEG